MSIGNEPSDLSPKEAAFGHVGRRIGVTGGGASEPSDTVYVVTTLHAADRGPRCEGVYRDESDAENGKREALEMGALEAEVYEMGVR